MQFRRQHPEITATLMLPTLASVDARRSSRELDQQRCH
jgi:hypothetical protein